MTHTVGVVSDTHCELPGGQGLPAAVLDVLAGCDLIVHCGDIVHLDTLDSLQRVAPVVAVRSGVDPRIPHPALTDAPLLLRLEGTAVGVLSRPADLPGQADLVRGYDTDVAELSMRLADILGERPPVVLYRGSHSPQVSHVDGTVFVDPGSPTRWAGRRATVGRLTVGAGQAPRYEVVDITPLLPVTHRAWWRYTVVRQAAVNFAYRTARRVRRRATSG